MRTQERKLFITGIVQQRRVKKKFAMSNTITNKSLILVEDNIREKTTI